jgi:hypothetical protein
MGWGFGGRAPGTVPEVRNDSHNGLRSQPRSMLTGALTGIVWMVAIAHRLHTGRDADRVAVIEDGRVCELGSHEELVAAEGAYADLWRSWHGSSAGAA